jgi:LysM repeat protein
VGQKLVISAGNVTPSATLSPIQKLTPDTDGNYYHTVQSGETLSWIASLYGIPLADLMSWNGLNNTSIIRSEQKLLLRVTPPATPTHTAKPETATPSPYPTITQSPPTETPTVVAAEETPRGSSAGLMIGVVILVIGAGGLLMWRFSSKG